MNSNSKLAFLFLMLTNFSKRFGLDISEFHFCQGSAVESDKFTLEIFVMCSHGDHGGVVSAVFEFWHVEFPILSAGQLSKRITQAGVGRDATRYSYLCDAVLLHGFLQLDEQHLDERVLDAGAKVRQVLRDEIRIRLELISEKVKDGSLDTGE